MTPRKSKCTCCVFTCVCFYWEFKGSAAGSSTRQGDLQGLLSPLPPFSITWSSDNHLQFVCIKLNRTTSPLIFTCGIFSSAYTGWKLTCVLRKYMFDWLTLLKRVLPTNVADYITKRLSYRQFIPDVSVFFFCRDTECTVHRFSTEQVVRDGELGAETK